MGSFLLNKIMEGSGFQTLTQSPAMALISVERPVECQVIALLNPDIVKGKGRSNGALGKKKKRRWCVLSAGQE